MPEKLFIFNILFSFETCLFLTKMQDREGKADERNTKNKKIKAINTAGFKFKIKMLGTDTS